jgi:hypothetical protein
MGTRSSAGEPRDPVTRLQDRWYNAVVEQMLLSPDTFQLSQPSPPIANDAGLWDYLDALPPLSLTFNHRAWQRGLFFTEYAAVARQIQFSPEALCQEIGEDNHKAWQSYLQRQNPAPPPSEIPGLFMAWASVCAPSVAATGTAELSRVMLVDDARRALDPYLESNGLPPDFRGSSSQLLQTMEPALGARISFDSRTSQGVVSNTWAGGRNHGLYGLWAGSPSDTPSSNRFADSHMRVEVRLRASVVWTSTPGAWYHPWLLQLAYTDPGSPPWPPTPNPTWQDVFGEDGSLARVIASLVVVDGIDATIISGETYNDADQKAIASNCSSGLWPLYIPSGPSASNTVTFDSDAGMRIETVTEPGRPLVLGANVLGITQYLGHRSG